MNKCQAKITGRLSTEEMQKPKTHKLGLQTPKGFHPTLLCIRYNYKCKIAATTYQNNKTKPTRYSKKQFEYKNVWVKYIFTDTGLNIWGHLSPLCLHQESLRAGAGEMTQRLRPVATHSFREPRFAFQHSHGQFTTPVPGVQCPLLAFISTACMWQMQARNIK